MNKELMYIGDQVIVTNENGSITKRSKTNNLAEILEIENKLEGLEDDTYYTRGKVYNGHILKRNVKKLALTSIVLFPAIFLTSYLIGNPAITSVTDCLLAGAVASGASGVLSVGLNLMANKEIKNYQELLEKQNIEIDNNKQKLNQLIISNTKVNNTKKEIGHKLDLKNLKKYRARIIAEHYFQANKEKIMKFVESGNLRKRTFIDSNNNEQVYNELENIAKSEKDKVKTLKK